MDEQRGGRGTGVCERAPKGIGFAVLTENQIEFLLVGEEIVYPAVDRVDRPYTNLRKITGFTDHQGCGSGA